MDLRDQIEDIIRRRLGTRPHIADALNNDITAALRTVLADKDTEIEQLRTRAQAAEERLDGQAWVDLEAERDRFAEQLTHQINLHTQRAGHDALDRRACQTCKAFRELRELPSIVAAQVRIYAAIGEALSTGNYAACFLADDGTPVTRPGDTRKGPSPNNCYCGGPEEIYPHRHGTGIYCRPNAGSGSA